MSYLKYGSSVANQGCGNLNYTPDFYPGTLANGLVSRPVDVVDFKSAEGLKFVIDTPLADQEGLHQFILNVKSDLNNALIPQGNFLVKVNVLKACEVELDTHG